jgi:hypothetical protein
VPQFYQPEVSDLAFPNFHLLRERCLDRMWAAPLTTWSSQEKASIRLLTKDYACRHPREQHGWTEDPAVTVMARDLESAEALPKWVALASWLAPESIVSQRLTELVTTIATLATTDRLEP